MITDEPAKVQEQIARDRYTRPDTLAQLYRNSSLDKTSLDWDYVLLGLANNPNTPKDILYELAHHHGRYVRELVARNPSTSQELLHKLASDRDHYIKYSVAKNPNTSPETLLKLMNSKIQYRDFWDRLLPTILDRDNLDPKVEARARKLYRQYCP
jgi:3-methyladenine DNA glycosylase AlkC